MKFLDVVRAYKSIESEKKALETALSVISHDPPSSNQSVPDVEYTKVAEASNRLKYEPKFRKKTRSLPLKRR
jgi:hypothetical protein